MPGTAAYLDLVPSPVPGDPTRLLVAGDTHGNHMHWKHVLLPAARKHQVDGIVQLGDFGYWPLTGEGLNYLAWLSAELDDDDLRVIFVDGNHEDHKALRQLPARADGFVEVTDRILWAPRGHRWTWQGVRFLALGGAYSIDGQYRKLDSGRWGVVQGGGDHGRGSPADHRRRAGRCATHSRRPGRGPAHGRWHAHAVKFLLSQSARVFGA